MTGALRMNLPPFEEPIANIGVLHWGFDFRGFSVGERGGAPREGSVVGGTETMQEGMDSPCGIIPDSGSTFIMGPAEQVSQLEASICSEWPRCRASGTPSSYLFKKVLSNCSAWLTEHSGLEEVPSLFFRVRGTQGGEKQFELTSWAWVNEQEVAGLFGPAKVCTSALGTMEYATQKNGPIWIFGSPLFYEYEVGYDLQSRQISLHSGGCAGCPTSEADDHGPVSLASSVARGRRPRPMQGTPRAPYIDPKLPL
jgi:hypothetical protein